MVSWEDWNIGSSQVSFFLTLPYFSDQAEPAFPEVRSRKGTESGLNLTGKSSACNNKYFFKKLNIFLWKAKSIYVKEKQKSISFPEFLIWPGNMFCLQQYLETIESNNGHGFIHMEKVPFIPFTYSPLLFDICHLIYLYKFYKKCLN